jgi:hypothetical protein
MEPIAASNQTNIQSKLQLSHDLPNHTVKKGCQTLMALEQVWLILLSGASI